MWGILLSPNCLVNYLRFVICIRAEGGWLDVTGSPSEVHTPTPPSFPSRNSGTAGSLWLQATPISEGFSRVKLCAPGPVPPPVPGQGP